MEPTAPRFHLNDVVEACVDYERPPQPGINFHASVDPQRWLARQTRRRLSDRVSASPTAVHLVFDELELADLALRLAVGPWQSDGSADSGPVLGDAVGE